MSSRYPSRRKCFLKAEILLHNFHIIRSFTNIGGWTLPFVSNTIHGGIDIMHEFRALFVDAKIREMDVAVLEVRWSHRVFLGGETHQTLLKYIQTQRIKRRDGDEEPNIKLFLINEKGIANISTFIIILVGFDLFHLLWGRQTYCDTKHAEFTGSELNLLVTKTPRPWDEASGFTIQDLPGCCRHSCSSLWRSSGSKKESGTISNI